MRATRGRSHLALEAAEHLSFNPRQNLVLFSHPLGLLDCVYLNQLGFSRIAGLVNRLHRQTTPDIRQGVLETQRRNGPVFP
jgi:hypothetical protein